ncbi:hypothetical protein PilKf_02586 [Pillotina sp. SPG140]
MDVPRPCEYRQALTWDLQFQGLLILHGVVFLLWEDVICDGLGDRYDLIIQLNIIKYEDIVVFTEDASL